MNTRPTTMAMPGKVADKLLKDGLARDAIEAIESAGGEARFVGGVVRDALLDGLPGKIKDIDMASTLPPDEASAALEAAGLHVVPTGIEHGTVTVCRRDSGPSETVIELTTLRQDIETDGRHAKVRFGTDWLKDAERRDFTINSMSMSSDGTLHDPLGGADDLQAGRVRFVGNAHQRIREDYLRILRFFRFHARFGKGGEPDRQAMDAITELAGGLERISGERMAKEVLGIMEAGSLPALEAMVAAGVDRLVSPTGFHLKGMGDLLQLGNLEMPPAFRLGFALGGLSTNEVAGRLKLSKRDTRSMEHSSVDVGDAGLAGYESETWRKIPWRSDNPVPKEVAGDDLACIYAANAIRHNKEVDLEVVSDLRLWKPPPLPVTGDDLIERGIPAGKKLGAALGRLEDAWVESDFKLDRDALLKQLADTPASG